MYHLLKKFARRQELNKDVKDFLEKHRLNVIDTNKRAHKITRMNTRFFESTSDYNVVMSEKIPFETERLYTIEIAESELQRLAEFEAQVFNNLEKTGHYRMFEVLMEQKELEKYLRDRYPAVKKAYEQYSLMLALANSGGEFNA
jgi:hypothetical protein